MSPRRRVSRSRLAGLLGAVILIVGAAVLTVWRPKEWWGAGAADATLEPLPAPRLASAPSSDSITHDDFVGSVACAQCHTAQYTAWSGSTHARAGGTPGSVRVIAPFDGAPMQFADAEVIPRGAGGRFSFTVRQTGASDRVYAVDAVVGGGHMEGGGTQGFLSKSPDGTLRFLPFDFSRHTGAWFCNTIGRVDHGWVPVSTALSITDCVDWPPTRVLGDVPRFSNCQSCHGSQITVALDTSARAWRTRFTSLDINCEACHGPGRRHMALARDTGAVRRGDLGIPVLATLSKDASLGTCWQCHALKDQLRDGFLSGMPLERYYSLRLPQLGDASHAPDGRVRTFAYQQGHLYSDCYLNGGMTCTSCHDPHTQGYRDVNGAPLDGRFDDRQCTGCHASKRDSVALHTKHDAGSRGSSCVGCHMPYLQEPELGAAIRYARSDHSIPIPRPASDSASGIVSACRSCHADKPEGALDTQARQWWGEMKPRPRAVDAAFRLAAARDVASAAREVLVADERHTAALFAGMSSFLERFLEPDMPSLARDVARRLEALARHSDLDVRAMALASLHYARGTDALTRRLLASHLETAGADEEGLRARWSLVLGYLGDRLRGQGNPAAAISTYRKAQEVDPGNPRILVNLALAHADAGNPALAVSAYRESLRLDPAQPLTLVNLGIALAGRNDLAGAEEAYRRAIALDPRETLAWFNLAGALVQKDQLDSAAAAYRQTVAIDPGVSLAYFYLARLYLARGDAASALREIEIGLRFDPGQAEARAMRDELRRRLGVGVRR